MAASVAYPAEIVPQLGLTRPLVLHVFQPAPSFFLFSRKDINGVNVSPCHLVVQVSLDPLLHLAPVVELPSEGGHHLGIGEDFEAAIEILRAHCP